MKITIRNSADLANKYLRFIKWKSYSTKRKFDQLLYVEVMLSKEGNNNVEYKAVIKLGVPGNDIVLMNKSNELPQLWKKSFAGVQRYLRKYKEKRQQQQLATSG